MNWLEYPNFSENEFRCKHTGKVEMVPEFMERLQRLRKAYGSPMVVTSGYRSPQHPIEAKKASPGEHATGRAVDIGVRGSEAVRLIALAHLAGFTRIGVQQKGEGRFIHLGDSPNFPPGIWSY